jgi:hypothetical protein
MKDYRSMTPETQAFRIYPANYSLAYACLTNEYRRRLETLTYDNSIDFIVVVNVPVVTDEGETIYVNRLYSELEFDVIWKAPWVKRVQGTTTCVQRKE